MNLKESVKQYRQFRLLRPVGSGWFYRDEECTNAICDAYLAEHPPDDDEPITAEWLRDGGWDDGIDEKWFDATKPDLIGLSLVDHGDGYTVVFGESEFAKIKTRRQLRRLIAALKGE
jgi:hypothetical protein